jgi:hypothetical protein
MNHIHQDLGPNILINDPWYWSWVYGIQILPHQYTVQFESSSEDVIPVSIFISSDCFFIMPDMFVTISFSKCALAIASSRFEVRASELRINPRSMES